MQKIILTTIIFFLGGLFQPKNFDDLTSSQKQFILELAPKIIEANKEIKTARKQIIQIKNDYLKNGKLTSEEEKFLSNVSSQYDINTFKLDDEKDKNAMEEELDDLMNRVDVIPARLVMAQAIIESGWGKSYFAKEAYNYFGIHCYSIGCGIVPKGAPNADFEVKKYPDIESGIEDYLHILNTFSAYDDLRKARSQMRSEGKTLDPVQLAASLTRYSQKGAEYVTLIRNVIHQFLPVQLDELIKEEE